jgi:hypothetical protein
MDKKLIPFVTKFYEIKDVIYETRMKIKFVSLDTSKRAKVLEQELVMLAKEAEEYMKEYRRGIKDVSLRLENTKFRQQGSNSPHWQGEIERLEKLIQKYRHNLSSLETEYSGKKSEINNSIADLYAGTKIELNRLSSKLEHYKGLRSSLVKRAAIVGGISVAAFMAAVYAYKKYKGRNESKLVEQKVSSKLQNLLSNE